ncbi:hepcidin isoform X2 [Monodelphis domestica]|uniref:hepcidin isoform X2 n=1 Tax=Monodelphis domestica TaxID=13616 RepID=UPI0004435AE1|nr:hepcidin isoform X2 [Monodelphis domestica]
MAPTTRVQAACLCFLLLSSWVCCSVLPSKTQDLVETPFQEAAPAAHNGLTPLLQRTKRFNSHFPICSFCCNCCHNTNCGICCRV